jgi:hypothetical protein
VHFYAISHNVPHVCDAAPSPTRARGHVAERRAAAPRSPRRPKGAPMYVRTFMRSCADVWRCIWRVSTRKRFMVTPKDPYIDNVYQMQYSIAWCVGVTRRTRGSQLSMESDSRM